MDREVVATRIALALPSINTRIAPCLDGERSVDLGKLDQAKRTMSSSERALVDVGIACWTGQGSIEMAELLSMGDDLARRALTALAARVGLLDSGAARLSADIYRQPAER